MLASQKRVHLWFSLIKHYKPRLKYRIIGKDRMVHIVFYPIYTVMTISHTYLIKILSGKGRPVNYNRRGTTRLLYAY